MLHLKCSGKSYRSPCNFENAQVALRWPNRYTFYSNAFLKHFYRSKSTLDRLKVFSMYLRGNRRWLFLRLWLKNCTQLSKLQEVIMRSPMSMFTPRDKYENLCLVRPSLRLHFPAQFFFFFFFFFTAMWQNKITKWYVQHTSPCAAPGILYKICGHIWSKPVLVEPHNKLNIADLRQ